MSTNIIFVTNTNDFTHVDYYDGVEYVFPPKERVAVPAEGATLMLGFNMPDKTDALVRLGWAWTYNPAKKDFTEDPEGVRKLARFIFTRTVLAEEPIEQPAATLM